MAVLFTGIASTQRISGTGLGNQNCFAIENGLGSNRLVRVRAGSAVMDPSAFATAIAKPSITMYRGSMTEPAGTGAKASKQDGAILIRKGSFDQTQTSEDYVRLWCAFSPDGLGISNLTATLAAPSWHKFNQRMHDLTGQIMTADPVDGDYAFLPRIVDDLTNFNLTLYPGEAFVWAIEPGSAATAANNPLTNQWLLNLVWTEETLNTYTISGNVKLASVGVVGAEVIVVVADDNTTLANAFIHSVNTTTAGGAWSAAIPNNKYAYAYAQNFTGGIYYTSPGAPFVANV